MKLTRIVLSLAACGLFALPHAVTAAPRATVNNLGTLGGTSSQGRAINNSGQVAGYSPTSGGQSHAFLWSGSGGMQDLGTLGGSHGYGMAINASGQVAGYSNPSGYSITHAFLWSGSSGMQDLGTLGGAESYGQAINASGQVAGYSYLSGGQNHAFLWSGSGSMQDLGTLGGSHSYGQAINASGQVAGYSATSGGQNHAFLWSSSGGMQDLGTLGGTWSYGYAINNSGQVTGYSRISSGPDRAFLWSSSGGMQDLGTLGGTASYGQAINASGQVAGYSYLSGGGNAHAFLWNAGTMYDLNSFAPSGWTFTSALGINDLAQVAGNGTYSGATRAYRLTLHPDWQGGNGNWSDASKWNFAGIGSFGITPGAPHDVVINPVASATVSGPTDATVNALSIFGTGANLVTLNLNSGSVTAVAGTTLGANGSVTGNGRLAGNLAIQSGGLVSMGGTNQMQLAGNVSVASGGRIDAISTTTSRPGLWVGGALSNASGGAINLMNADVYGSGGIANAGRMSLSGITSIVGLINTTGQVNVSGNAAEALFWDNFTNNGSVNVTTGSMATFFGLVNGAGSFLGDGTKNFAGGYAPGNSPELVTMEGNIIYSGGALTVELGGTTPGSGHDKIVFLPGSTVTLDGVVLSVEYWNGWTPSKGDAYDLFDWSTGSPTGTFSQVLLPTLANGLAWNASDLYEGGILRVAAVPEPESYAMFLAGLGLLGFIARNRKQAA